MSRQDIYSHLIQRAKEGEEEAFKLLYDQHQRGLFLVCLRYGKNREDAEDYLQEAFIRIYRKLNLYDSSKGKFQDWAKRVTINVCLKALRKKSLYSTSIDDAQGIADTQQPDALSKLSLQELVLTVQNLPPGYRSVFNLYVIDGYAHAEIAKMLAISESTSKTQLMKARRLIQKKISERSDYLGNASEKQMEEYG